MVSSKKLKKMDRTPPPPAMAKASPYRRKRRPAGFTTAAAAGALGVAIGGGVAAIVVKAAMHHMAEQPSQNQSVEMAQATLAALSERRGGASTLPVLDLGKLVNASMPAGLSLPLRPWATFNTQFKT